MTMPTMEDLARTIMLAMWGVDYTPRDLHQTDLRYGQACAGASALLDALKPVVAEAFMAGVESENARQLGQTYELSPLAATRIIAQLKGESRE